MIVGWQTLWHSCSTTKTRAARQSPPTPTTLKPIMKHVSPAVLPRMARHPLPRNLDLMAGTADG